MAELLGYIRGYDHASEFRQLGTKTWDANATAEAWYRNPNREKVAGVPADKIEDDYMGRVYGVQGRDWRVPDYLNGDVPMTSIDQLKKIVNNLSKGIDDRGEILMFWNPGELDKGCLRPCMYSYHFSILGDTLYLNATQR